MLKTAIKLLFSLGLTGLLLSPLLAGALSDPYKQYVVVTFLVCLVVGLFASIYAFVSALWEHWS